MEFIKKNAADTILKGGRPDAPAVLQPDTCMMQACRRHKMSKAQHIDPAIIRNFIVETFLFGDASGLNDETSFMETGIIDSLGILKVTDFIEHSYNIKLSPEHFVPENLDSIDNIVRFLKCNIAQPTSETNMKSG